MPGAGQLCGTSLLDHRLEDLVGVRLFLDIASLDLVMRRDLSSYW